MAGRKRTKRPKTGAMLPRGVKPASEPAPVPARACAVLLDLIDELARIAAHEDDAAEQQQKRDVAS